MSGATGQHLSIECHSLGSSAFIGYKEVRLGRWRSDDETAIHDLKAVATHEPGCRDQSVRQQDLISPTLIGAKLNVSVPTVIRVLEDLIEEDLVEYSGFGESTGGRRPAQVKFKGSSYAVLGIDLGGQQLFGAVSI